MDIILVYSTTPSLDTAQSISRHLLEKKLIACANIHESTSMFWWENRIRAFRTMDGSRNFVTQRAHE